MKAPTAPRARKAAASVPAGEPRYAIGVDFGTNSVRALVVDIRDGREVAVSVFGYPTGEDGVILDPSDPALARQSPADYIDGFLHTVREAVKSASSADPFFAPEAVVGIGVDTTGSTPIPVVRDGTPLAFLPEFHDNPAAQAWLWKDHTSAAEAAEITAAARAQGVPYLGRCGGSYSSEWFWAKVLHCKRTATAVFDAAYSWVELCDFIPAYAAGCLDPIRMKRSVCAAGHKAMFAVDWGGLPSAEFLASIDPELARLRYRLYSEALPSDHLAGHLCPEVAKKVGLPPGIAIAVGAFDCHHGAVGAGIKPGTLVKVVGTSSCDLFVAPRGATLSNVPGVCGVVMGSVIPGVYALEAGQSAVGDILKWYVDRLCPAPYAGDNPYAALEADAARLRPGESGLLALDWNNGNRTILNNQNLTGLLLGQTLYTTGPEIYRALVEATAFGARAIQERTAEYGVATKDIVLCGGLAEKSPLLCQIYADVLNCPIRISRSAQTCALGAALFGAVASGAHKNVAIAQRAMTGVRDVVYKPVRESVRTYARLYALYRRLHDAFGTPDAAPAAFGDLMPELIAIRQEVRHAAR